MRGPGGRLWRTWSLAVTAAAALGCAAAAPSLQETAACGEGATPSEAGSLSMGEAQSQTPFHITYPCRLPPDFGLQRIVIGGTVDGSRSLTLVFRRPGFDTTLELTQSERETGFTMVPEGMTLTRPTVQGVSARLVEGDSGTGHYLFYLAWSKGGVHYQLQGTLGAGLTRESFLAAAGSIR